MVKEQTIQIEHLSVAYHKHWPLKIFPRIHPGANHPRILGPTELESTLIKAMLGTSLPHSGKVHWSKETSAVLQRVVDVEQKSAIDFTFHHGAGVCLSLALSPSSDLQEKKQRGILQKVENAWNLSIFLEQIKSSFGWALRRISRLCQRRHHHDLDLEKEGKTILIVHHDLSKVPATFWTVSSPSFTASWIALGKQRKPFPRRICMQQPTAMNFIGEVKSDDCRIYQMMDYNNLSFLQNALITKHITMGCRWCSRMFHHLREACSHMGRCHLTRGSPSRCEGSFLYLGITFYWVLLSFGLFSFHPRLYQEQAPSSRATQRGDWLPFLSSRLRVILDRNQQSSTDLSPHPLWLYSPCKTRIWMTIVLKAAVRCDLPALFDPYCSHFDPVLAHPWASGSRLHHHLSWCL